MENIDRKTNAILRIISEASRPIGSKEISEKLKKLGIDLTERAIRYHLKMMDESGLTKVLWKEGRTITKKGSEEIDNSMVSEKIGLVSSKIEAMACQMDFDLEKRAGRVILNVSFVHKSEFKKALRIMRQVFEKKLSLGNMVAVAMPGQELGGIKIPTGRVGFGTLCSVNLNGIMLKSGIPIESKFAGVLQIEKGKPLRFTDLISYSGSTLDPIEVFIRSKMTSVREAAVSGSGKILAGFREIPSIAREKAEEILYATEKAGLGGALVMGKDSQSLLGIPVGRERVGLVVPGGLDPIAAVEEWGIETESKALVTLVDYKELVSFWDI